MYPNMYSIDKINNQIAELERLKNNFQNVPQQAPVNIYNNAIPNQNDFKARILNENEKVDEILINSKTMFFDNKKGKLYIKEINGDIQEFDVVLPKSKLEIENEELKERVKSLEKELKKGKNNE